MPDYHDEGQTGDDVRNDDGSSLGLPERFDPGYYNDSDGLPQVCCDCGELFLLPETCKEGRNREGILCQFCDPCLDKFFKELPAACDRDEAAARRLGLTLFDYYKKLYGSDFLRPW